MRFPIGLSGLLLVAASPIRTTEAQLSLTVVGTFRDGRIGVSAAEIVDYDPCQETMYVVNSVDDAIDVIDIGIPSSPNRTTQLKLPAALSPNRKYQPSSVVVIPKLAAVAACYENTPLTDNGIVAFFAPDDSDDLEFIGFITVGPKPDMITITPNGKFLLVANEGTPEGLVDPEGSISVIDLPARLSRLIENPGKFVTTIDFKSLNGKPNDGIRIEGNKTASEDLEPEYITVSPNSKVAFVSLQENNAIAKLDLTSKPPSLVTVFPMELQDHSKIPLDANDIDLVPSFRTLKNLFGMPMPDTIAAYNAKDRKLYVVTANEGDARSEEVRVRSITLDLIAFPNNNTFFQNLRVSNRPEDKNAAGKFERLLALGTRSFSIYDENGKRVYDSGNEFEAITGALNPTNFNADSSSSKTDDRSDNKGPEPEALDVGEIDGRYYAFIGLERVGGVMVYDITVPCESFYVTYVNNRDFSKNQSTAEALDLAPESIKFVHKDDSPTGSHMLLVANEVSGTTTIYNITNLSEVSGTNDNGRRVLSSAAKNRGEHARGGSVDDEGRHLRELTPVHPITCKKSRRQM